MSTFAVGRMFQFFVCILLLVTAIAMYKQHDYTIVSERFEFVANDRYFSNLKYVNYKFNRTFHAVNVTADFTVDFGYDIKIVVQGYKLASNEYRLFPIQFDIPACECLEKNCFGIFNTYKCGHMVKCPLVKGNFGTCKWQPDFTRFPPFIPTGSYRFDFNFTYFSVTTMHVQWYCTVKRDIVPFY